MKNYYKILGVRKSAKREDILKAYSKLLKEFREKKDKTLVNRNNIILITEAFNVVTDSSERVKYDREYKNYLENKDEIDRNEKNDRENKRREREEKILEEESKKIEEEEVKKQEETKKPKVDEAKKQKEHESKKSKEKETKKKLKKETKNKKDTSSNEGEDELQNKIFDVNFYFKKIQEYIKSPNFFNYSTTFVLIFILILVIISRCSSDNDFEDFAEVEKSLNQEENNDQLVEIIQEEEEEEEQEEIEEEEEITYPRRGSIMNYYCDGTTQVKRIHNGRGGFFFRRTENSEICGYEPPPEFERYGQFYKSECQGTSLVNIYHDGKGGFYSSVSIKNSIRCG